MYNQTDEFHGTSKILPKIERSQRSFSRQSSLFIYFFRVYNYYLHIQSLAFVINKANYLYYILFV